MRKLKTVMALAAVGALALTACDSDSQARDDAHGQLQSAQPAQVLEYSPTRETINFWVNTWNEPGKLSYVYLQNPDGDLLGYYVLEGLPVSYCAQISPPERSSNSNRSAPANDGAYYSGGGSCNTYYGKDATTGAYIEYTAGLGINILLFDQPLPNANVEPIGPTAVEDVD